MLRESEFLKNSKMRILLCLELLLLVIGIAGLFGKTGTVVGVEQTNQLLTEGVSLPAGVYTARLYYDSEQTGGSFGVVADDVRHRALLSNYVPLFSGIETRECRFYLLKSVDGLRVEVEDEDGVGINVQGVEIIAGTEGSRVFLFWVVVLGTLTNSLAVLYLYQKKYTVPAMTHVVLFGVPLLALVASLPAMVDYNITGADFGFHLMRIEALTKHICQGEFFSRIESLWLSGHGYANSVFYGDTFLLVPSLLQIIGFSIDSAYRMYIIAVNLATACLAYVCFAKCFRSREIGMFGCVLYTLAPYRLYNIYNRAAVGEYTAMIFLPLLAWGFYRIYSEDPDQKGYLWNWVIPMLGFSGLIQSHVLTCEMAGVCVILLCVILWKKTFQRNTFLVLATTVIMTVLVNAWFLVPFLDLMASDKYYFSNNANALIQNRGVLLAQLFYTLQAAGSSSRFAETGMVDTEPIGIGAALMICVLVWLGVLFKYKRDSLSDGQRKERKAANVALLLGCIMLGMSTCYFPWDFLSTHSRLLASLVGSLQFPTRLTGMATMCMTMVACVVGIWMLREQYSFVSGKTILVCIGLVALVSGTYHVNDVLLSKDGILRLYSPEGMGHSVILGAEYLPFDASTEHMSYHEPVPGDGVLISGYEKDGLTVNAYLETEQTENSVGDAYVEFPLLYYKGYSAKVVETGESISVEKGNNADVRVVLPEGFSGMVQVKYSGMWYWHLAEAISILSCAGTVLWYVLRKQREVRIG